MENKDWREEIRCNSNGCNCTKEERATNNGNCKHSLIVSMEDKSWLKTFSGELRKDIESLVKAVLKSKQEEIEKAISNMKKDIPYTPTTDRIKEDIIYNQFVDDLKPIINNILNK